MRCPGCGRDLEPLALACPGCGRDLVDPGHTTLAFASPDTTAIDRGPPAPEAEPAPPRLGALRVLRRLGGGGMGTVYEAEDEASGRRVAELLVQRSHALAITGRTDEALRELNEVLEAHPRDGGARLTRGIQRRRRGEWALAIEDLTLAEQLLPPNGAVYHERGLARLGLGERDAARADLRRAVELLPPRSRELEESRKALAGLE